MLPPDSRSAIVHVGPPRRRLAHGAYSVVAILLGVGAIVPTFEPVQPALLADGGAFTNAFADYDRDGDLDLFVGFNGAPNRLYRNDAGTLIDVAAAAGLAEARGVRAASWADFDLDGDPDLLVGFAPGREPVLKLYRNDRGRFTDVAREAGVARDSGAVRQTVWVDYDADGDLDLFVAFRDRPNALFRNDASRFVDVASSLGVADPRRSVGAVWFDYDDDGDLDLYVGNMDGDANGMWRNDGDRFTDVAAGTPLEWGGRAPREPANGTVRPCVADVNNDGRLDIFTANYGPNGLLLNRGGGRFEDVSAAWGIATDARYDACAFSDFDHDGRVDLYVNGTVTGGTSHPDRLYRNEGTRFVDVTPPNVAALEADHGVQWADFDGDGDEDLALTGSQPTGRGMHHLLRNMLPAADAQRSFRIRVTGERGHEIFAGSIVRLYSAGTRDVMATRWIDAGSGYDAQSAMPLHVPWPYPGLADIELVAPRRGAITYRGIDLRDWRGCTLVIVIGDRRPARTCP